MIFEALPARYGDSLLLTVPDGGAKRLMVIDGGPGTVYEKSLAPALAKLASAGRPLDIDAVMVSHVDEDHILGVTQLFQAIQKAKVGNKMPPYRVRQLMFNGFDKIIAAPPAELAGPGSVLSSIANALDIGLGGHAAEVLASVGQGSTLSSVAAGLGVPLNLDARPEGELMMLDADPLTFAFGESSFMIVGPRRKELDDLRREWEKGKYGARRRIKRRR
jgi:hypothetical protein